MTHQEFRERYQAAVQARDYDQVLDLAKYTDDQAYDLIAQELEEAAPEAYHQGTERYQRRLLWRLAVQSVLRARTATAK